MPVKMGELADTGIWVFRRTARVAGRITTTVVKAVAEEVGYQAELEIGTAEEALAKVAWEALQTTLYMAALVAEEAAISTEAEVEVTPEEAVETIIMEVVAEAPIIQEPIRSARLENMLAMAGSSLDVSGQGRNNTRFDL